MTVNDNQSMPRLSTRARWSSDTPSLPRSTNHQKKWFAPPNTRMLVRNIWNGRRFWPTKIIPSVDFSLCRVEFLERWGRDSSCFDRWADSTVTIQGARSETGVWQMVCHLRQCDFHPPTACASVWACAHTCPHDWLIFSNRREIVWKKKIKRTNKTKWDMQACVHTWKHERQGEVHRGWALMHAQTQRRTVVVVGGGVKVTEKKPLVLNAQRHTLPWLLYWFN